MKLKTENLTLEAAGKLDANACTKFILPMLAAAARPAYATVKGMLIYNTDTNKLNIATHASWNAITSST